MAIGGFGPGYYRAFEQNETAPFSLHSFVPPALRAASTEMWGTFHFFMSVNPAYNFYAWVFPTPAHPGEIELIGHQVNINAPVTPPAGANSDTESPAP